MSLVWLCGRSGRFFPPMSGVSAMICLNRSCAAAVVRGAYGIAPMHCLDCRRRQERATRRQRQRDSLRALLRASRAIAGHVV